MTLFNPVSLVIKRNYPNTVSVQRSSIGFRSILLFTYDFHIVCYSEFTYAQYIYIYSVLNINSIAVWSCHVQCTWIWIRGDGKSYITIMLYAQNVHKYHAVYLCLVVGEIFMCSFFLHPASQPNEIYMLIKCQYMNVSFIWNAFYIHTPMNHVLFSIIINQRIYIIRMWWFHTDICEDPMQFNLSWNSVSVQCSSNETFQKYSDCAPNQTIVRNLKFFH